MSHLCDEANDSHIALTGDPQMLCDYQKHGILVQTVTMLKEGKALLKSSSKWSGTKGLYEQPCQYFYYVIVVVVVD